LKASPSSETFFFVLIAFCFMLTCLKGLFYVPSYDVPDVGRKFSSSGTVIRLHPRQLQTATVVVPHSSRSKIWSSPEIIPFRCHYDFVKLFNGFFAKCHYQFLFRIASRTPSNRIDATGAIAQRATGRGFTL
jgi:hypothetical protein